MRKFEINLLNELLDKYEKSVLSKKGSNLNIHIRLSSKNSKTLKGYNDSSTLKYLDENEKSLLFLEDEGFIKIKKDGDFLDYVELKINKVDEIFNLLNRKSKNEDLKDIRNYLSNFDAKNQITKSFIEDELAYISNSYAYHKKFYSDINELKDILISLDSLLSLKNNMRKRDFSTKYLKDSKLFECYENKIISILRNYSPYKELDDDNILEKYKIIKNSSYVIFKNNLVFKLNDQIINLDDLKYEYFLTDEMIKNIKIISSNAKKIITVENLTSFYELNDSDSIVIYLAGYQSHTKLMLIKKIMDVLKDMPLYHWGDIDVGGMRIFINLKEILNIDIKPYLMDLITLKNAKVYKKLTINDKTSLNKMLTDEKYSIFKDVIEYMLENNIKLEQESLD